MSNDGHFKLFFEKSFRINVMLTNSEKPLINGAIKKSTKKLRTLSSYKQERIGFGNGCLFVFFTHCKITLPHRQFVFRDDGRNDLALPGYSRITLDLFK